MTIRDPIHERTIRTALLHGESLNRSDEYYLIGCLDETRASLRRLRASLATFVRETADPGVEALAAIAEAEHLL